MEILKAKVTSGGKYLACCCPFCVDSGKSVDTKFHLCVAKGKYCFCYRCGFKKSYKWFISNFTLDTRGCDVPVHVTETGTSTQFDHFILTNTTELSPSSVYGKIALNYLRSRKITFDIIKLLNIKLGVKKLFGRIAFIDEYNKYFMARSFLNFVLPKTLNPPTNITQRPLMYLRDDCYDTLFLVEGVFDLVPFLKTNRSVCCLLGKDVSKFQLDQLSKIKVNNIIIVLDPDAFLFTGNLVNIISRILPFANIGTLFYNKSTNLDPSSYDVDLFNNNITIILWDKIINDKVVLECW